MTPTPDRHPAFADVPDAVWDDWHWQQRNRVRTLSALERLVDLTNAEREGIRGREGGFPFAITPYYLGLFGGPACPVRRQAVPLADELRRVPGDMSDPLGEDDHAPVPGLVHRYPDRALLYVTHACAVYCRHCTRQRKVGDARTAPSQAVLDAAIEHIGRTPAIRDVLVSGGDPLSLSDARLVDIVARLRAIEHVDVIRLCTRMPVTMPQRITQELLQALRPYHPLFVSTHFNHPAEGTARAGQALDALADAGFSCGNQMVLLAGINDDASTVEAMGRWLLRHRCRPYYLFQCDPVEGTAHLRTPIDTGVAILDRMRGRVSGLAIPQLAVDLPGGGGKITLAPERLVRKDRGTHEFRDVFGRAFTYVDPPSEREPDA